MIGYNVRGLFAFALFFLTATSHALVLYVNLLGSPALDVKTYRFP